MSTDYAKANCAYQTSSSDFGGLWWLRSPTYQLYSYSNNYYVRYVFATGAAYADKYYYESVSDYIEGIVPALTISLE